MTDKPLILSTPATDYPPDVVRYADRVAENIACRIGLALGREQIDCTDIQSIWIQHEPTCGVNQSEGCTCSRPLLFETAIERIVIAADGSCTRAVKATGGGSDVN